MMRTLALLIMLALAGCAGRIGQAVDTTIDEARQLEDAKARAAINAQCATGVGALQRNFTPEVQEHVWKACGIINSGGGTTAQPAAVEDLIREEPQ